MTTLDPLFEPKGVAVIGVSRNPVKLGYGVARNLVISGYDGPLYLVNPKGGSLFDRPFYADIGEVPDPLDLAVIIIPAAGIPSVLESCGERGVRAVIIAAGGFREVGEAGLDLEKRCLEIAQAYQMRVLGPNCIGYLDTHLPIDTSFLPLPGPIPGDIAFLSHSGAICEAVIDWARGQGFGLSRLISVGNQMDLCVADLLGPTAEDPNTRVIALYLEGVRDGKRFVDAASAVSRDTPVLAIKVGRTERGSQAVASHTGALAGEDAAFEAAFRKAGILRAQSSEELFDWARALAWCPLPEGPNIAVLTNAGGPGAIAVDALEWNGLELAEFSKGSLDKLRHLLPPAANIYNPVDMLAGAGPREFTDCLLVLLADPGVDGVMVIIPPPPMSSVADIAGAMIPIMQASTKPVVVTLMGEDLIIQAARLCRQARIPDYRFPERAASALAALFRRAELLRRPAPVVIEAERPAEVGRVAWAKRLDDCDSEFLPAHEAGELASLYGIRVPTGELVQTEAEAVSAAEKLGYPVALKLISPELPHKTDAGAIVLSCMTEGEVLRGFNRVIENVNQKHPDLAVTGVLVERMAEEGMEVILGVVRDQQFGNMVMFGSGGVEVETQRDVAFALTPLTDLDIQDLFAVTEAGNRLGGGRGRSPRDQEALRQTIVQLSQLAQDFERISELEINPLRVYKQGNGVLALDVRIRLSGGAEES